MAKENKQGITTKKSGDLSDWYSEVVQKAELADYSPVKGFMIIRPNAYSIWEKIQNNFDAYLKSKNIRNAYFPLLIPESFFKREAEHAKGFAPELAWVERNSSAEEDSERL
ncbi:MAG: proline--tRNA ligase, partial [Nanoarchaeota archaeon]